MEFTNRWVRDGKKRWRVSGHEVDGQIVFTEVKGSMTDPRGLQTALARFLRNLKTGAVVIDKRPTVRPLSVADYDRCIIDGKGRARGHPDFDPTIEGPCWKAEPPKRSRAKDSLCTCGCCPIHD